MENSIFSCHFSTMKVEIELLLIEKNKSNYILITREMNTLIHIIYKRRNPIEKKTI